MIDHNMHGVCDCVNSCASFILNYLLTQVGLTGKCSSLGDIIFTFIIFIFYLLNLKGSKSYVVEAEGYRMAYHII